jgi:hypothetical protein
VKNLGKCFEANISPLPVEVTALDVSIRGTKNDPQVGFLRYCGDSCTGVVVSGIAGWVIVRRFLLLVGLCVRSDRSAPRGTRPSSKK